MAAALVVASACATAPYMPVTCCGFDTQMMLDMLFKCTVGEEGKPWSRYCANPEAQHCAHFLRTQNAGAEYCCERCRLRALGEWDDHVRTDASLQEEVVAEDGFTYPY